MKKEATKILFKCAEIYDTTLLRKNLLIVTMFQNNIKTIEVRFPRYTYKHLTGVDVKGISAKHFYSLCLDKRLKIDDFEFKVDGTTRLKLAVLESLLRSINSVKMVTDFHNKRVKLKVDKLAGGVHACLGLMLEDNSKFCIPKTVLKTDLRNEGDEIEQVLFIAEKLKHEKLYNKITYISKKINFENLKLPREIREKIDPKCID